MREQISMLGTYFGHTQKDYWHVFFGDRRPQTPLSDVAAWTDYFRVLLGAAPQPQSLSEEEVALKQQLYAAAPSGQQAAMAALNADVTQAEVEQCMALPTGKAPDAQGLTGELLRLAAAPARGVPGGDPLPECPVVVECTQWLLQAMLSTACVPEVMCTSKLVPVPKSLSPAALAVRDQYRGISVSPVFSRLLDRFMNQRFERLASALSLRAPTQCGFRPGHGTLDAIFTLQHLISVAQHSRRRLFVVFVDFKKAFDKVRRDLLLERCRKLGVHGPFLDMLVALYDRVCCQVAVNGELGEAFPTASGTKQGSELSPLLFGLFIELLHYLIKLKLPGAGPVLSGLNVPDVMYADDVGLLSFEACEIQQIVDVLDVFCTLFDMEVNLAPHKTCVVCFRPRHLKVPAGFRLVFRGREISLQSEYVYLGVRVHATRGLLGASDALAVAGSKAMHAVLTRCRRACLTQFDIKCRMFDILVEPVLSYASHIWGPAMFAKRLHSRPYDTKAESVHTSFLRIMTGSIKGVAKDVLYRDLHRTPVMYHWVVLAARWWTKMSDSRDEEPRSLASCVWREDVALALDGCQSCWSYGVLHTMSGLHLLDSNWRQQPLEWVLQQRWQESAVQAALAALFRDKWQGLTEGNPRTAPSAGIHKLAHHAWVYPLDPSFDPFSRDHAAPHMKLCLSFNVAQNLAQLRVGSAHLEIEQGRKRRESVPREDRLCRLCSGQDASLANRAAVLARTGTSNNVEDLKHFMLECPVYDDLRAACPAFADPASVQLDDQDCVAAVFQHAEQSALAHTLYKMKVRRARLLGLTLGI
jgi:sorting nexin-29